MLTLPTCVLPAGEFFRLVAGDTNCRDVVACSEGGLQVCFSSRYHYVQRGVSVLAALSSLTSTTITSLHQAIRCPPGLAFSLKKQTCEWRRAVSLGKCFLLS